MAPGCFTASTTTLRRRVVANAQGSERPSSVTLEDTPARAPLAVIMIRYIQYSNCEPFLSLQVRSRYSTI